MGPRSFDPVVVGNRETDAWAAYYLHDWRRFLVASVGLVGAADPEAVRPAARKRVEAMDLSDRWVKAGCHRDDPLLAGERRALVASYAALRNAVEVRPGHH